MPDIVLRVGANNEKDVQLFRYDVVEDVLLFPGANNPSDVILRPYRLQASVFPTQYSGLRCYYGGAVNELCLVATADAPAGMGASPRIPKGGVTYAIYLVDTTDSEASPYRMRTSAGTKAVRKKT